MKPVEQLIVGGPDEPPEKRGDCVRAAICSVLELPITALPNYHGDDWWMFYVARVNELGAYLLDFDFEGDPWPGIWIASVPSINLPPGADGVRPLHVVVMYDDRLVWDPSRARKRESVDLDEVVSATILVAHEPAAGARRARELRADPHLVTSLATADFGHAS